MNHFFIHYIQPMTQWLHLHPNTAIAITFLIALCESLIVLGTLIPGSFCMTALGILAGSGVMRIDLTLIAAIIGAIAGDGISYIIGSLCSEKIATYWPFNRYPKWLNYGKSYFQKHGGKSIIIGRFFGPLRSLIPVIAGMMHMERSHFIFANVLSAIIWSVSYVVPGIIIGAVSSELSPEHATNFFVLILALLLCIWIASWVIRWIWIRCHKFWRSCCDYAWTYGLNHTGSRSLCRFLTPQKTSDNADTMGLLVSILLSLTGFVLLMLLPISHLNQTTYLFLQSIRTDDLDKICMIFRLSIMPITLFCVAVYVMVYAYYLKNIRLIAYWLSLWAFGLLATYLLPTLSLPVLTMTAALFFLNKISKAIPYFVSFFLLCLGFSILALAESSISVLMASYLLGFSFSAVHILLYRRRMPNTPMPRLFLWLGVIAIICTMTCINIYTHYATYLEDHKPVVSQHALAETSWLTSNTSLLPLYLTNHFGKRSGLLNIQYAGNLDELIQQLKHKGWKVQPSSFLYRILMRTGGKKSAAEFPLLNPLYQDHKPIITLTLKQTSSKKIVIIRFWESGYYLEPSKKLIYLGSMVIYAANHFQEADLSLLTDQLGEKFTMKKLATTMKDQDQALPLRFLILLQNQLN
jgi:membrane protein DedA with SNARE-associated domain